MQVKLLLKTLLEDEREKPISLLQIFLFTYSLKNNQLTVAFLIYRELVFLWMTNPLSQIPSPGII